MAIFITAFWALIVVCVCLHIYTKKSLPAVCDDRFRLFQRTYLVVYLLAVGGDWLQGPHVYALYESYGMTTHQIQVLFVAGFGSSMVFGTIVGSLADKYGRRTNCILYGVLYALACVTKHFGNFWILMIGRLLGGIATSVLYSAFESWLVYEHHSQGFQQDTLGLVFSNAVLGNSLVAILAGIIAQYSADMFGFVAPFDVSLLVLLALCICLSVMWTENYGDKTVNISDSLKSAIYSIKTDRKILCLGLIQSLFEGSMYTFVLEWTPALTSQSAKSTNGSHRGSIPHGYIFAAFMVAIMIGSSLFKLLSKSHAVESFMRPVLFTAALSLAIPIGFPDNQSLIFLSFLTFEVCVGIFWPALSTMRGKYVPEETRATVMNCFRIPLNFIVVCILLQNLQMSTIFMFCVVFLLCAAVTQAWLHRYITMTTVKQDLKTVEPELSEGDSCAVSNTVSV